jgi:hypothetical protein
LYYNEEGKLIYAEITHYRGATYCIYFHDDELLYTKVGPFFDGELFIDGNMKDVEETIGKDSSYEFVRKDILFCLDCAYKEGIR